MPTTLQSALLFLVETLFGLYLFVLMIRILLVYARANYFDPFTQFITKLTNFIVKPLRRMVPNIYHIETASVLLAFLLIGVKYMLIDMLTVGMPNMSGLLVLALGEFIRILLLTFFYAILAQAILSWVQPHSPMSYILSQLTAPVVRPFQRLIPTIGGFDISMIPALIVLQLLIMLVAMPLMNAGATMMLR